MAPVSSPSGRERVGPHPSYIEIAKPYILQSRIQKCLTDINMSDAKEDAVRLQGVAWIDQVRRALQLPIRTFNTAVIYYHKFRLLHSDSEYNWADASAAALFTACKIEDTLKKSREILCANWNLKVGPGESLSSDDPRFENHSKLIIGLERLMLESAGFDFRNRYPQKLMVKLARALRFDRNNVSKTAWNLSIDLYKTFAPLKQSTPTLAIACLELAARLHEMDATRLVDAGIVRYSKWSTSRAEVMETLLDLLDLYTHHRGSTAVGPFYTLEAFIDIRIGLNQEASAAKIPRYALYASDAASDAQHNTNGIKARNGIDPTSPLTPATPGTVSPGNAFPPTSAIGIRGQDGTVRFMLDAARARDERNEYEKFHKIEEEEYEVEVPIDNRSEDRDKRTRDLQGYRKSRQPRSEQDDRIAELATQAPRNGSTSSYWDKFRKRTRRIEVGPNDYPSPIRDSRDEQGGFEDLATLYGEPEVAQQASAYGDEYIQEGESPPFGHRDAEHSTYGPRPGRGRGYGRAFRGGRGHFRREPSYDHNSQWPAVSPYANREMDREYDAYRDREGDDEAANYGGFQREHSVGSFDDRGIEQNRLGSPIRSWRGRGRGPTQRGSIRGRRPFRRDWSNQRSPRRPSQPYRDPKTELADDRGLYSPPPWGDKKGYSRGGRRGNGGDNRRRPSDDRQQWENTAASNEDTRGSDVPLHSRPAGSGWGPDCGNKQGDSHPRSGTPDTSSFIHPDRAWLMSPNDEPDRGPGRRFDQPGPDMEFAGGRDMARRNDERCPSTPRPDRQRRLDSRSPSPTIGPRHSRSRSHGASKGLSAEDGHQWVRDAYTGGRSKGRSRGRGSRQCGGRGRGVDRDRDSSSYMRSPRSPRAFDHVVKRWKRDD